MIKGAIFDMDGLLFDTERMYRDTWDELAVEFGQELNPHFTSAVAGSNGETMIGIIRAHYPELDPYKYRDACFARVIEKSEQNLPEKKGVRTILNWMRENGFKIAVASSSYPETIMKNLRQAGMEGYFDVVTSGSQVKRGKPAPDIFLYAAEMLGMDPKECYVFEDSLNGVKAGAAAGCRSIMIPDLTAPTEEIRAVVAGIYEDLGAACRAIADGEV